MLKALNPSRRNALRLFLPPFILPQLILPGLIGLGLLGTGARVTLAGIGNPLIEQAETAQNQGDYAKAEALWRQVLQQQPPSASAYYNLGLVQHRQLNLTAAITAYEQALKLDPRYSFAQLNLGLIYLEVRRYDKAIPAFERVLTLPNQPSTPVDTHTLAHYDLAIIYHRQGNTAAARQALQKALALTPNFVQAQQLLQRLPE
jgi:tetratricopeptide (TPR) repeat protein